MKRYILLFALLLAIGTIAESALAQIRRAERALRNEQLDEAMALINTALEGDPEDDKAYEVRARIHQAQATAMGPEQYIGHVTAMKEDFERAMTLNPKVIDDITNQLQIFWVGEFNKGIEQFNNGQDVELTEEQAAFHYRMSAQHFEASAVVFPDSADSYVNWAYALLRASDDVGAIRPFTLALEYGSPDLEIFSFLGRIYLTNEMADDAVPVLETGVEEFPNDVGLQDLLLNAYAQTGQTDRALARYKSTVESNPSNRIYRYNYGSLLLQSEEYDEAIVHLSEAIALDPGYVDAYYNLGAAYINKANSIQVQINALDDSLRANRDTMSAEEQEAESAKIDELIAERVSLYEQSIPPLEEAKRLGDADEARNVQEICMALYQAYGQTNQMEKLDSVSVCAEV